MARAIIAKGGGRGFMARAIIAKGGGRGFMARAIIPKGGGWGFMARAIIAKAGGRVQPGIFVDTSDREPQRPGAPVLATTNAGLGLRVNARFKNGFSKRR